MSNTVKIFLFFLFVTVAFNFCNERVDNLKTDLGKAEFIKILPKSKTGILGYDYLWTQILTKSAGLSHIEDGFDSICIRLWYSYLGPLDQVIDLKKNKGLWSAEFFTLQKIESGDSIRAFKKNSFTKIPKSGWNYLIKKLFFLGINTLPQGIAIPDYDTSTHATIVTVEIATQTRYRIYSYFSPKSYPHIKEAKNIEDIMKLIEQEFEVKRIYEF